jgi:hypothetical protein
VIGEPVLDMRRSPETRRDSDVFAWSARGTGEEIEAGFSLPAVVSTGVKWRGDQAGAKGGFARAGEVAGALRDPA